MFPIKDTIRSRTFPIVNWLLIIANLLMFLYELSLGDARLRDFISVYGLVPAQIQLTNPFTWYSFITHMFLHGGWVHLLSNIWILFIFGDNVEDRMGSASYLVFYLVGGIVAGLVQNTLSLDPRIPSIGASGAIAAVLGAYIFFYPRSRVITLILLFIFPWFVQIPALIFLGLWFISQLFSGLASISAQSGAWGGVAWWAHIGGFVFGLMIALFIGARRRASRWHPDEYYPW
jgi:membrane associated rhomboid family serine protease